MLAVGSTTSSTTTPATITKATATQSSELLYYFFCISYIEHVMTRYCFMLWVLLRKLLVT